MNALRTAQRVSDMSAVDLYRLYGYIVQWVAFRNRTFKQYWPVKGGWEQWIQVDLAASILSADSSVHILRNQPIYFGTNHTVDLLLNASLPGKQIAVEIRAQSVDSPQFLQGVQEDMVRLASQREAKCSKIDCVIVAMPFARTALKEVLALEWRNQRIFRNFSVFIERPKMACCIAAWSAAREWHQPLTDR